MKIHQFGYKIPHFEYKIHEFQYEFDQIECKMRVKSVPWLGTSCARLSTAGKHNRTNHIILQSNIVGFFKTQNHRE